MFLRVFTPDERQIRETGVEYKTFPESGQVITHLSSSVRLM